MLDQSAPWPVLTHYEGNTLTDIAFPLGGIGTGTIALGGRAELRDFEVLSRPSKGFTPPCGWAAFLEKFWVLKHYLDCVHRFSKQTNTK